MNGESRTAKSIRNVKVALLFYILNLILQFFSRKIFLDYLGSEVLGLNTTAQNLLGFLNLAELGIGSAVAYNLYKPLFDKDRDAVNAIVSIQGWLYRRIAYIVIAGACVLMCFFPMIFAKAEVPLWYAYGTFIAFLTSSLLGYFINYKQIVLSADQKEYKITYCTKGGMALKVILQIIAISTLKNGYIYWIAIELFSAFIISWGLNKVIKQEYVWLCPTISQGKKYKEKYPQIITKTKQLFFHKIGGFVLSQTSPLIIYAYSSLSLVAIYGNYMLIVLGVISLMNALLNGINAGIGNLIAENNQEKIKFVFWKITTLRIWIASIVCFGMYILGDSFITLWVGNKYLLPQSAFIPLIVITFINLTRTNDAFLAAYGLFQDIWAPIVEACLNLGLSILFGFYWGLTGILIGVAISLIIVINSWKPYFLYKKGFKENIMEYVFLYTKKIVIILICFGISYSISKNYIHIDISNYYQLSLYGLITISLYIFISLNILYFSDTIFKSIIKQLIGIIFHQRL